MGIVFTVEDGSRLCGELLCIFLRVGVDFFVWDLRRVGVCGRVVGDVVEGGAGGVVACGDGDGCLGGDLMLSQTYGKKQNPSQCLFDYLIQSYCAARVISD